MHQSDTPQLRHFVNQIRLLAEQQGVDLRQWANGTRIVAATTVHIENTLGEINAALSAATNAGIENLRGHGLQAALSAAFPLLPVEAQARFLATVFLVEAGSAARALKGERSLPRDVAKRLVMVMDVIAHAEQVFHRNDTLAAVTRAVAAAHATKASAADIQAAVTLGYTRSLEALAEQPEAESLFSDDDYEPLP